jgi:hypothetical protein
MRYIAVYVTASGADHCYEADCECRDDDDDDDDGDDDDDKVQWDAGSGVRQTRPRQRQRGIRMETWAGEGLVPHSQRQYTFLTLLNPTFF